jgi:hypothetical protein
MIQWYVCKQHEIVIQARGKKSREDTDQAQKELGKRSQWCKEE